MNACRRIRRVPTIMRRPRRITAGVIRTASWPLANVHNKAKLRTRDRARSATCWAMTPPIECPTTCADSIPTASSTASASAAITEMESSFSAPAVIELLPMPRLSIAIKR